MEVSVFSIDEDAFAVDAGAQLRVLQAVELDEIEATQGGEIFHFETQTTHLLQGQETFDAQIDVRLGAAASIGPGAEQMNSLNGQVLCEQVTQMLQQGCWNVGAHDFALRTSCRASKRGRGHFVLQPAGNRNSLSPFSLAPISPPHRNIWWVFHWGQWLTGVNSTAMLIS